MKKLIAVLMIGALMFGLFGCANGKKYSVDYCGQKEFYEGAKDAYRAGQTVHLEYGPQATDTDYHFYINADNVSCCAGNGYTIIKFTMPEHNVVVECRFENTMEHTGN